MKSIINAVIINHSQKIFNKVLNFDKTIVSITDEPLGEIIDAKGNYISAGFIDAHIHGSGGQDTMNKQIDVISSCIVKNGVTSFLPTTMTMSKDDICDALDAVREAMKNPNGAKVIGAHMEGPFINKDKKGAQKEDYILEPDFSLVEKYIDVIKTVSYAPENDKDFKFLKECVKNNISVSLGHTCANYNIAKDAFLNGANCATHLFNAMPALHHRDPGVLGAVFENDNAYAELIADTIHVNKALYKTLHRIKGDRLCLITDSMEAGSMPDGKYQLGGQDVFVKDKSARLQDGTLAGSILKLNEGIKNFCEFSDVPLEKCITLATESPAKRLFVYDKIGSLDVGKLADITMFNENLDIKTVIIEGEIVYKN